MSDFLVGLNLVFTPTVIGLILGGVCVGILFGATPGLTTSMGMAFLLPITFVMQPAEAISLLIGLYIGGTSGGLITATLIGIPGTPAAIATTFDGYPMSKKGEPGKALGYGIFSSFFGGMISLVFLVLLAPALAKVALKFGPADYFAVSFFSLSLIASLAGKNMAKGLLSGLLGLMLATVGMAPLDTTPRFTFGNVAMEGGFQLLCVVVGVYAVAELLKFSESSEVINEISYSGAKIKGIGITLKDLKGQFGNLLKGTAIGTAIGILPGIGAGTSNLISYSVVKNTSKYPEKFGSGIKDGIIASESANNAVTGGALVPLLTMGIPGDVGTALLMAGLTLHGISPGPLVFTKDSDLIYAIFIAMFIANVLMLIVLMFGSKGFLRLVNVPKHYLLTTVLVVCVLGAFSQNNRVFDTYTVIAFGALGYAFNKLDITLTPFIMGYVLGPIVEKNLLRGLLFADGNFLLFFKRPIAAVFISITILYLGYVAYKAVASMVKPNAK